MLQYRLRPILLTRITLQHNQDTYPRGHRDKEEKLRELHKSAMLPITYGPVIEFKTKLKTKLVLINFQITFMLKVHMV